MKLTINLKRIIVKNNSIIIIIINKYKIEYSIIIVNIFINLILLKKY